MNYLRVLWRVVPHIFGMDVRSLAAFRMAAASTLFYVLFVRLADLEAIYSDNGIMRRSSRLESMGSSLSFSFHMVSGNPTIIRIIFAVHFAALVCMFIGYKTRPATFICWLGEMSLQSRNHLVNQGGDNVCRLVCMYGIFLPLGSVWSVDAWLRIRQKKKREQARKCNAVADAAAASSSCFRMKGLKKFFNETSPWPSAQGTFYSNHNLICSLGTAAFASQCTLLYWNAGLLKHKSISWYKDWTALEFALHTDSFTTWFGVLLRSLPEGALMFLTVVSLLLELWAPLILLPLSLYSRKLGNFWRGFVVVSFYLFHIGIRAALDIGHFSAISMVMWTIFIPGDFWEGRGKCCAHRSRSTSTVTSPSPPATCAEPITERPISPASKLLSQRKTLQYNLKLSQKPTWENILLGIILYVVLSENVGSYYREERQVYLPVAGPLSFLSQGMQLRQSWGMFTNMGIFNRDGWYETVGLLRGNTTVDLMAWGGPVPRKLRFHDKSDYSNSALIPQARGQDHRPDRFSRRFASQRWRKYIMNLRASTFVKEREAYGKYLCRAWNGPGYRENKKDEGQLLKFNILFHSEPQVWHHPDKDDGGRTLIGGEHKGNDTKVITLHSHKCFTNVEPN